MYRKKNNTIRLIMEGKLFILGFLLFWISFSLLAGLAEEKNGVKTIISSILLIISFIMIMINFEKITEKRIAEKFLKGEKPYRMEINYKMADSIVTSVDTVYIKIE